MPYSSKEKWNTWNKKRRKENTKELITLKSNPCVDCKNTYPYYVMEFDHVPEKGEKKANIGCITGSRKMTAPSVQEELAKCDLVCANCHKIRTHFRNQQRR